MAIRELAVTSIMLIATVVACGPEPREASTDTSRVTQTSDVDSIVLERTMCYGTCPAYRVRLTSAGLVTFESRSAGDVGRTATDSVAPERISALARNAAEIGFFDLRTAIADDPSLCPARATDHPSTHVSVYGARTKTVEDYQGCYASSDGSIVPALVKLRVFE